MTLKTPPPSYVGAWALHWLGSVVCFRFLIALFGLHEISVHAAQMGVSPLVGSCLFLLLFLVVSALTMGVSCGLFAITVHAFTVKRWCEARALPVPPRATLPYTRAWWSYFGGFFLWIMLNSLLVSGAVVLGVLRSHSVASSQSMAESGGSPLGMWLAVMVMVAVVVGEFWVMFAWFRRQVHTRILSRLEREVPLEETSLDLHLPPLPPAP